MIPLYKLEKLPRNQKLGKIAKFLTMAENRLRLAGEKNVKSIYTASELVFFFDAAKLLMNDGIFPENYRKEFSESAAVFEKALNAPPDDPQTLNKAFNATLNVTAASFRRALNSIKHLLLTETGREQSDWDFTAEDGGLDPVKRHIFEGMCVYLEDIRSPFNVGAMFRTAESFGVEKIILSPFCADPGHRRAQRTAMGCIEIMPWERQDLFASEEAPEMPCPVFALETGGVPMQDFTFPPRGILIAGSEELGVSPRALAAADASLGRVSIPCYGAKASLNVSVAFGIALQAWAQSLKRQAVTVAAPWMAL